MRNYYSSLGFIFFDWNDFLITPIYIYIFYRIVKSIQQNSYKGTYKGQVLMTAFWLKVFGSLAISLIYEFYYRGGDMESYFWGANSFYVSFFTEPAVFFKLVFSSSKDFLNIDTLSNDGQLFLSFITTRHFLSTPEFTTIKVSGLVSLFTFHTFSANALFFSMFSFFGSWKLFLLFCELYPQLEKKIAIACFYIPSIVFWGSGLLKDPLTYGSLCLIVYLTHRIFINLRFSVTRIFALLANVYFVIEIKPYIFLSALPCLMLLILLANLKKIDLPIIKAMTFPFLIVSFFALTYIMANSLKEQFGKYSIEQLSGTMQTFQTWHQVEADMSNGAGYTLGDLDYSTFGLLKKFPLAINVTFFRPYIWETRKPIILLSALESLWLTFLTIRMFVRISVFKFFNILRNEPFLMFCFIFSMIFAYAVGMSSYNFGALVRYKIPCMVFYLLTIFACEQIGMSQKKAAQQKMDK